MVDMTSIGAALQSAKAILDLLKNVNDAQISMRVTSEIASLQGKLIDVQQQVLTTQAESEELRAENQRLRTSHFHHGVNWRTQPDGAEDGPFCPICVAESTEMRLQLRKVDQSGPLLQFECPKKHQLASSINTSMRQVPKNLYQKTAILPALEDHRVVQFWCARRYRDRAA